MSLIPLAQVVSIEFTMPIWTAVLAVSFLGERMNVWKILAVVLGLVGVAVIVRPAAGEINPGQMIALAAAVGFGISVTMIKSLTRTRKLKGQARHILPSMRARLTAHASSWTSDDSYRSAITDAFMTLGAFLI